jgi:plasmid stability protein
MTATHALLSLNADVAHAILTSKEAVMGSLTIRNLDDRVKQKLRERAAAHGVSMEQEVRSVLADAVGEGRGKERRRPTLEEILALGIKPTKPFDQKAVSDELWSYLEEE